MTTSPDPLHMTAAEYVEAARLAWSEDELKEWVLGEAQRGGWLFVHFRPARTDRGWRTAMEGDKGFPDLVLARGGVVILAELKSEKGRVSPDQEYWIKAAGAQVWRPSDWPKIQKVLA